ncbi:hypothetical protein ACCT25_33955, partial [Rhizobium ruizarguesonis]
QRDHVAEMQAHDRHQDREGKNHMAYRPKATCASRKRAAIYSPRSRRFLGPSCNFRHTRQLPVE